MQTSITQYSTNVGTDKTYKISDIIKENTTIDYGKLKEITDSVIGGRTAIRRLNPKEEQGRIEGGRIHVETSILLGAIRGAKADLYRGNAQSNEIAQYEESILGIYAIENNLLFNEEQYVESHNLRTYPRGEESTVYQTKDQKYMIKFMDYSIFHYTPTEFLDDMTLFNYVFNETAYEMLGFSERNGKFTFIMKQAYIQGLPIAAKFKGQTPEGKRHIVNYLNSFGFINNDENGTWFCNSRYVIDDLHFNNVFLGNDNRDYIIDGEVSLNTEEDGIGGTSEYFPFEVVEV